MWQGSWNSESFLLWGMRDSSLDIMETIDFGSAISNNQFLIYYKENKIQAEVLLYLNCNIK